MTRTGEWGPVQFIDAAGLALLAVLLRIPAFLAPRALHFDDGGYALAAISMRSGRPPFQSVFSSQGPIFLQVIHLFDLIGLQRLNSPRLGPVLAGAAIAVAAYRSAGMLTDRGGALLAGALAASSGAVLWTTGPITGDGIAAAFGVWAVAEALNYRTRPATHRAVVVALLMAAAMATKSLLAAPAIGAAWFVVLERRRWRDVVWIPIGAVVTAVITAVPWGIRSVYEQSIAYHRTVDRLAGPLGNLHKAARTLGDRDLTLLVLALLTLAIGAWHWARGERPAAEPGRDRFDRWFGGDRFAWWWLLAALIVVATDLKLWRNHVSVLVPPIVLLVACRRPAWRVVAVVAIITVPVQFVMLRDLYDPQPYRGPARVATEAAASIPARSWALSDTGGYIWRAGRATAPWYVDPSILRLDTPVSSLRITSASIANVAARPKVCLVLVTSPVRWGSLPDLPARLARSGYLRTERLGPGTLGVYRRPCRIR